MTEHYDTLETRDPSSREADLFARLPDVLRKAMEAPAYAGRLRGIDPAESPHELVFGHELREVPHTGHEE